MNRLTVLLLFLIPQLVFCQGLILRPNGTEIQKTDNFILTMRSNSDFEFVMNNNNNPSLTAFFEVFNGDGNQVFWVNEDGEGRFSGTLGINAFPLPGQTLAIGGQTVINHNIPSAGLGNTAIYINDPTSGTPYNGIQVAYAGGPQSGVGLFSVPAGGLNVGDAEGNSFEEISASAFTVSSDRRVKKDIEPIEADQQPEYMDQIRDIRSIRFRYNSETTKDHPEPHIGVIAQSLPDALIRKSTEHPNGAGQEILTVSLADWLGLLTVGVKSTDHKQQELADENQRLRQTVEELRSQLARMEAFLQKELDYTPEEAPVSSLPSESSLGQNQPNPTGQETIIPVEIPEGITSARLLLYDSQGRKLRSIAIGERGRQQITLSLVGLPAGSYSYALLIDGQRIATRQLIRQ